MADVEAILAKLPGRSPAKAEEPPEDPMAPWYAAGADLIAAIEKKDHRAVGSALRAAFEIGESMPEDEAGGE